MRTVSKKIRTITRRLCHPANRPPLHCAGDQPTLTGQSTPAQTHERSGELTDTSEPTLARQGTLARTREHSGDLTNAFHFLSVTPHSISVLDRQQPPVID